jgi:hypothetical protein
LIFWATLEIADLLRIAAFMHDLGCHDEDPDPEDAYDRLHRARSSPHQSGVVRRDAQDNARVDYERTP